MGVYLYQNQAKLKIYINGAHGDSAIKTPESVDGNLDFVDQIMYSDGKNPYRSKNTMKKLKSLVGKNKKQPKIGVRLKDQILCGFDPLIRMIVLIFLK
jgi:hypothetical protein